VGEGGVGASRRRPT